MLANAHGRIGRERYEPLDVGRLSAVAGKLLRACIAGDCDDGDETKRPAYRELVKARITIRMGSFKGDECVFRLTYWGRRRRKNDPMIRRKSSDGRVHQPPESMRQKGRVRSARADQADRKQQTNADTGPPKTTNKR